MKRPELRIWPATGRHRVKRYLSPTAGPVGTPAHRWAVIGPLGEHIGSSPTWPEALDAAHWCARNPEERW